MGYAFFDVDGTLISLKSMLSFQDFWYATAENSARERALFEAEMGRLTRQGASREEMNRRYYAHFAGRSVAAVDHAAERWFAHIDRSLPHLFHLPVVERLERHRRDGLQPVFVSGSFPALLRPIGRRLGVKHILATDMEIEDEHYTGRIRNQTIGAGKVEAITAFLAADGCSAAACAGYGDDISDLPMLSAVGAPAAVKGDPRLEMAARRHGWEVLPTHWTPARRALG
ncbi:MAG: HAD family hydrolase [Solirubrobacterales bacterium]